MSKPNEQEAGGIQSHQLSDLQESLTPERTPRASIDEPKTTSQPANPADVPVAFQSANPADVPLTSSKKTIATEDETTPTTAATNTAATETTGGGGGVTGFIRSLIGAGGGNNKDTTGATATTTTTSPEAITGEQTTTHEGEHIGGQNAKVSTAPTDHTAVPDSLKDSDQTVGVARTQITEPVSQYAPALEAIAGEPVQPDPTKKFGPALGPITGEAPASPSSGIVASVTGAAGAAVGSAVGVAGAAVDTIKHAVGYEEADAQTGARGVLTPEELPKSGVVNTSNEGDVKIDALKPGTGTAATQKGDTLSTAAGTTVDDVPRSRAAKAEYGSATNEGQQNPGYLASAAGTVSSGAQYVKDSVAGLVGTGQAGDTSDQFKAAPAATGAAASSVGATAPVAATKTPIEYEGSGPGSSLATPASEKEPTVVKAKEDPLASQAETPTSAAAAPPTARDLVHGKPSDNVGVDRTVAGTDVGKGKSVGTDGVASNIKTGSGVSNTGTGNGISDIGTGSGTGATGDKGTAEKKADLSSDSSKPVVSAFAAPSSSADKKQATKEEVPSSAKAAGKTTGDSDTKPVKDVKPSTAEVVPDKTAATGDAATKKAATGTGTGTATEGAKAEKAAKKEKSGCCGCVIS